MPLIVVLNENGQHVAEFTLGDRSVVIGRSRNASIRLDDKSVSAEHCRVILTPGGVEVEDLGSTNGVRAEGRAVPRATLRPGSRVQIGRFSLEVPSGELALQPFGAAAPPGPARPEPVASAVGTEPKHAAVGAPVESGSPPQGASSPPPPVTPVPVTAPRRSPLAFAAAAAALFIAVGSLIQFATGWGSLWSGSDEGPAPVVPTIAATPTQPEPPPAPVTGPDDPLASPDPAAAAPVDPLAGLEPVDPAGGFPVDPPAPPITPPESPEPGPVSSSPPVSAPPTADPVGADSPSVKDPIPPVPVVAEVDPEFDTAAIRQSHLALSRRVVGKTQPVTLRGGEVMEGIILEITDSHVLCRIARGAGSAEIPFPIETVEKIGEAPVLRDLALLRDAKRSSLRPNDPAGLYSLARWCGTNGLPKSRHDLLNAILEIDPNHAFARADLGYVGYQGGWRRAEELLAEGLGCWNGQWFTADELKKRGLVEYAGEWMTADEANARKGLVKVAGQWVTKDEAEKLRQGLVNYCGLWIPARVAFAIMKDSYYEQILRRARPMPAADFEKSEERIFALHLQKAEEDEIAPLTSSQRREELQRLAAIVRRARELSDADFALNVRLLAQEMVYRTQADRLGYDRYQGPLATARRVELESEIAAANLINAVKVNDHQAGHAYLIALEADRLRQDIESRAGKLNERAAKALTVLREALIGGVNVGFEVPPKIEGPAAGSDHEITVLREEYLKGLARLEVKLRKVLTSDQVAMAVQYQPTVDAVSAKDLDRKADKAKKNASGET